jgi:hypothetical protein
MEKIDPVVRVVNDRIARQLVSVLVLRLLPNFLSVHDLSVSKRGP